MRTDVPWPLVQTASFTHPAILITTVNFNITTVAARDVALAHYEALCKYAVCLIACFRGRACKRQLCTSPAGPCTLSPGRLGGFSRTFRRMAQYLASGTRTQNGRTPSNLQVCPPCVFLHYGSMKPQLLALTHSCVHKLFPNRPEAAGQRFLLVGNEPPMNTQDLAGIAQKEFPQYIMSTAPMYPAWKWALVKVCAWTMPVVCARMRVPACTG